MPAIESNEASEPANKSDEDQGTTQILPTKYFRDIDSLVKILQKLVGEKGTFEIEMQNTSYIIKSPDSRIELKDLVESIAKQRRLSFSVPDLSALRASATQHHHRHGVDAGLVACSNRQSLEEAGTSTCAVSD